MALRPIRREDRYPTIYKIVDELKDNITPEGVEEVLSKNKRDGEHKPMMSTTIAKRLDAWLDEQELKKRVEEMGGTEWVSHYEFENHITHFVEVAAKEAKHARKPRDFDSRGDFVYWKPEVRKGELEASRRHKEIKKEVDEWLAEKFEEVKPESGYRTYYKREGLLFEISTWHGSHKDTRPSVIVEPAADTRAGKVWVASVEDAEAYVQLAISFQSLSDCLEYTA